ncbi:hypothetical protein D3C87_1502330 [compost metagenome]
MLLEIYASIIYRPHGRMKNSLLVSLRLTPCQLLMSHPTTPSVSQGHQWAWKTRLLEEVILSAIRRQAGRSQSTKLHSLLFSQIKEVLLRPAQRTAPRQQPSELSPMVTAEPTLLQSPTTKPRKTASRPTVYLTPTFVARWSSQQEEAVKVAVARLFPPHLVPARFRVRQLV